MSIRLHKIILVALILLIPTGCREKAPERPAGEVLANKAYRQYFGEPPVVSSGRAHARVGYLPLRQNPDRVRAFPLFLFRKDGEISSVLNRLVGEDLVLPPDSPLFKPFPEQSRVEVERQDDVLEVFLTYPEDSSRDPGPMVNALVETAGQFDVVERVVIRFNNKIPSSMPEGGYRPDRERIAVVGPPALMMIAGVWHEGDEHPEEILVHFDRPVAVRKFRLFDHNGREIAGEYFTSIFQMAVVVRPDEPKLFSDDVELHVEWDVNDDLGRSDRGERTMRLVRFARHADLGSFRKK